jgi:hypothetical protein
MAQKKQNNDRWEPAFTATCSNTLVGATGVVTLTPRWFYTGILAIPTVLVRYLYGTCTVLSFIPVFWPYMRYLYGTYTALVRYLYGTCTVLSFIPVFWPYRRYLYGTYTALVRYLVLYRYFGHTGGTCTVLVRYLYGTWTVLIRYLYGTLRSHQIVPASVHVAIFFCPRGRSRASKHPRGNPHWHACLINTGLLLA